jgi:hypothetical protein
MKTLLLVLALSVLAEHTSLLAGNAREDELRPRALSGDIIAARQLGIMYYNGDGVAVDLEEAKRFLTSAAEQGDVIAERYLGVVYIVGRRPQDIQEAMNLFTKAADSGDEFSKKFWERYKKSDFDSTVNASKEALNAQMGRPQQTDSDNSPNTSVGAGQTAPAMEGGGQGLLLILVLVLPVAIIGGLILKKMSGGKLWADTSMVVNPSPAEIGESNTVPTSPKPPPTNVNENNDKTLEANLNTPRLQSSDLTLLDAILLQIAEAKKANDLAAKQLKILKKFDFWLSLYILLSILGGGAIVFFVIPRPH